MATAADRAESVRRSNQRWVICALLFFATTVNYIDRQVIGLLKPTLTEEFGWSERDYANIVFAFQAAYAIGTGQRRTPDRPDRGQMGLCACRRLLESWPAWPMPPRRASPGSWPHASRLGLGEAGNFPAAVRATADWFPKKERALAIGIFNSGSNVGAIITPVAVAWIVVTHGHGLAGGIPDYRRVGLRLAGFLVLALSPARQSPACQRPRTRAHRV